MYSTRADRALQVSHPPYGSRARAARPNGSRMLRGRTRPWEASAAPSGIRKQRAGNTSRLPGPRRRAPKRSNLAIRRAKHLSAISVYVPATTDDPFHYTSKAPSEKGGPTHVHPALSAIRTPGHAAPTAAAATGVLRGNRKTPHEPDLSGPAHRGAARKKAAPSPGSQSVVDFPPREPASADA
ncbi:hypothetical protein MTO96_013240 [Rhipicephalus appendiculatus]